MSASVLIAVTHLLGSGHLVRAANLARALAQGGFSVTLASGGMPLRAMEGEPFAFVQLPPIRTEGTDFRTLLDEAGEPIDPERRTARIARLEELAARLRPDVVIVEHFPFGRRQLAGEFLALIAAVKAVRPEALVLSSVRDVLVTPRPDRIVEAEERIAGIFDAVLVHGDAGFLPLDRSWPVGEELAAKLRYTGYLADDRPVGTAQDNDEVIVSGGGSAAALPLFACAVAAARLDRSGRRWRLLAGRGMAEDDIGRLAFEAPGRVVIERARPDFPALLAGCAVSISQAGYNTVLDLVAAGRPAIVVPFDAGNETEQTVRAEAMERAGLARCFRLSGDFVGDAVALADAAGDAIGFRSPALSIDRDGATRSAAIVRELLAAAAARARH
ncbi:MULTISPECIES: glycosyltransferase family protein [Bosea]|uniref:glycosyltransferase family protein n=1 Tax=Bosea TaxID=85413 RepID=UPI0021500B03|nr:MULTISPECIES: glycosyltransferase [Bosea]MCR4524235.1 glycosyl transferase [Bosea sp. 47.2.35]MDR6831177.1 putative glycosyltransferase [Bosea robiniae]MDR6897917.1 putative glycosyltransferase [Bosea sp. BE109]MDR7141324.1 putative glycosyltransferase [Bosea sp. BE168]MDR7177986.1 putative glycosyltransferase [Bosea sp. BE271]